MKRVFIGIGLLGVLATILGGCLMDSNSMVLPVSLYLGGLATAIISFNIARKVVKN